MFRGFLFLVVLLFVSGCSVSSLKVNETYPGSVAISTSEFDDLTEVRLKPAYVYSGASSSEASGLKVGARWSNRSDKPYKIVMQLLSPSWFDRGGVLRLKVDGVESSLLPVDSLSLGEPAREVIRYENEYAVSHSNNPVVRKEYFVGRDVLLSIIEAKEVLGRVTTTQGFIDFSLRSSVESYASPIVQPQLFVIALESFLENIDGFNSQASMSQ